MHPRNNAHVRGESSSGMQTGWQWYVVLGIPIVIAAVGLSSFSKVWGSR